MRNLPIRRHASNTDQNGRTSSLTSPKLPLAPLTSAGSNRFARLWPKTPPALINRKPIQLASADYKPRGYLVDFLTISGATSTTLTNGATYYIKTSYYSGSTLTVQADARVKFKNNTYMLLYGPMTFPSSGTKAVFTSRNDDSVGDIIQGVAGETNSNGDPSLHKANPALSIYFDPGNVTVHNTRFRWAEVGIRMIGTHPTPTHKQSAIVISKTLPAGRQRGLAGDLSNLTASNLKKCKVDNAGATMTLDCIGIENAWAGDSGWVLPTRRPLYGQPTRP